MAAQSEEKKGVLQLTFENVSSGITFSATEDTIMQHWKDTDAFQESMRQSKKENRPVYTFYDGPPFATGLPHYGHILAGTIKDVVTRYAHQTGYHVSRRFGWDTHGLPVEYEIDKKLKIKSKDDVLAMGIDQYNAECRAIVMRYAGEWERIVQRMGRWIDFKNDYKTLNPSFMESVWWVFKTMFDKGLVYQGFKVMPYSTGCHTPLSNFETGADCYKNVQDPAIVVSFPLLSNPEEKFLAWTTTPWTLPSNLALCVGPDMVYFKIKDNDTGNIYYIARSCLTTLYKDYEPSDEEAAANAEAAAAQAKKAKGKKPGTDPTAEEEEKADAAKKPKKKGKKKPPPFTVLQTMTGKDLEGMQYEPLFHYFKGEREKHGAWRVLVDDYVVEGSGTGIVHQAPGFGEDDYRVCLREGVIERGAGVICPVNDNGEFTEEVTDYVGQYVKKADRVIIKDLRQSGRLILDGYLMHPYPHCWRSDTPLIYKAVPSWFINVPSIKEKILVNNTKTSWVPEFVSTKRFANWLKDAEDWSVSRDRFWGTPLPIWISDDGQEVKVIGSVQELKDASGRNDITDLHRDSIDDITIPSAEGRGPLRRVPQVFDCWFESGSMPYAQVHYPFENKEEFEKNFPADFIAEGLDQTRGWFYTLMVISTALFDKPAFKNLVVNGLVLAEDGKKMSKRLKNYPDPMDIVKEHGADALRLYLINSPVVRAEPLRFKGEGVKDVVKDLFVPWNNTYRFFVEQHRRYELKFGVGTLQLDPATAQVYARTTNPWDKWILASLQSLITFVREEMRAYHLYTVVPKLVLFIQDLSLWYVRVNKSRMKGDVDKKNWELTLGTMYEVLMSMCLLMAPFTPFLVESMYQNLRLGLPAEKRQDSVHYLMVPEPREEYFNPAIERAVASLQKIIELGRKARDTAAKENKDVSFRVPLPTFDVACSSEEFMADIKPLKSYIESELNVLEVNFVKDVTKFGSLKAEPNHKPLGLRLKGAANAAASFIKEMNEEQVKRLLADGKFDAAVTVTDKKKKSSSTLNVQLLDSDITVSFEFKGDQSKFVAVSEIETGLMVVLSKVPDQKCLEQGYAREVMARVQRLRKEAALLAEDQVEVFFRLDQGSKSMKQWLPKWLKFIYEGIHANLLPESELRAEYAVVAKTDAEVNGEKYFLTIAMQRLVFSDQALAALAGGDASAVKDAASTQEQALGRLVLRSQVDAANGALTVTVKNKQFTLKEGQHFAFSLSDGKKLK